ncbi:MAG TPA: indolepyruvate ferredoxin oxidoreductase family protein [Bryobacterales bacterium]|nr:indolepyruvate ferredoxin oxidoreductase family protein [Bryobacterales bacterium]
MRASYSLDDKYTLEEGTVYLSGIQALVRLPMDQIRRDRRAGLRTGAFISGYEGSPLGGYDLALQRAGRLLGEHNIHFVPGVNEDIAATAVMGSQIHQIFPRPRYDGVIGIWYGKGPGVDRSGDVFRHANFAGTGKNCGALALGGDDHLSKSSTIPHQSDLSFFNVAFPVLYPGNTQDILDLGLYGIALSRYSGAWTGMKMVTNVCDGGGTVEVSPERCPVVVPELEFNGRPYEKVMQGMLIVPYTLMLEQEIHYHKLEAARAFARENRLNRIVVSHTGDRLGIVTAGKSYYDLRTALRDLGLDDEGLARAGVRILKLGMTYPLEPDIIREFARGLGEILVIEEKRSFIEMQLRDLLYNAPERPAIYGKNDERGERLVPTHGELDPDPIARIVGARILARTPIPSVERRLARVAEIDVRPKQPGTGVTPVRPPSFCSGCPHNRSTLVPDGMLAGGGIGCHGMAGRLQHIHRGFSYITQMGGEGAPWIGIAPFTESPHLFQNVGDGTFFHSATLAVSACAGAGVNITFKILYNNAVAMTGGQQVAGGLPIPDLTRQLEAQGLKRIVILTDDLERYRDRTGLAPSAEVRYRDELEPVMEELSKTSGATAIIYDQQCAAEKRRQRSRGKLPKPTRLLVINEEVCEGCGDCVAKSNCLSLHPVETEYGQKTRIHQSSCNADYSCLLGDCPSFVSVMVEPGTGLRKRQLPELPGVEIGEPAAKVTVGDGYEILIPGIGGTGVVTLNALLATAALLDGLHATTLDQTGLSQKGGAVVSSILLAARPAELANKSSYGSAHLLLGCDLLGAAAAENLKRADPERTIAVVNSAEVPTGDTIRKGAAHFGGPLLEAINRATRARANLFLDATRLAEALFSSHMAANIFLLGAAYQAGYIPLAAAAIEQAIELNGVAVAQNLAAFRWGRKYQHNPEGVEAAAAPAEVRAAAEPRTLDEIIERRACDLARYQDWRYAQRYRDFVAEVRRREGEVRAGSSELREAVARYLYKLMAYKDEYEVARLLTVPDFERRTLGMFEAPRELLYNLHPPLLRAWGLKKKIALGPWFKPVLRSLAALRRLRGTPLDPFGYAAVRRRERGLIAWYEQTMRAVLAGLHDANFAEAVQIASSPDAIRGYEQIKLRSMDAVERQVAEWLEQFARAGAQAPALQ